MAPLLFRGMKGVNISCASPASTAICTGMEGYQRPHMGEKFRMKALNSLTHSPSKMKSYHQKSRKSKEKPPDLISPASSSRYLLNEDADFLEVYPDWDPIPSLITREQSARFQSVKGDDSPVLKPSSSSSYRSQELACSSLSRFQTTKGDESAVLKRLSPGHESQDRVYFRSASSSSSKTTRFHIKEDASDVQKPYSSDISRDQVYFRAAPSPSPSPSPSTRIQTIEGDESAVMKPSSSDRSRDPVYFRASSSPCTRFQTIKGDESAVLKPSYSDRSRDEVYFRASTSSSPCTRFQTEKADDSAILKPSSSPRSRDQVVVLRVSLHCKGCEGKVRKHISRMEGVTSFNIDFATKKVTVVGDVTPLGVLSSISKVKNAQFWPLPTPNSSLR